MALWCMANAGQTPISRPSKKDQRWLFLLCLIPPSERWNYVCTLTDKLKSKLLKSRQRALVSDDIRQLETSISPDALTLLEILRMSYALERNKRVKEREEQDVTGESIESRASNRLVLSRSNKNKIVDEDIENDVSAVDDSFAAAPTVNPPMQSVTGEFRETEDIAILHMLRELVPDEPWLNSLAKGLIALPSIKAEYDKERNIWICASAARHHSARVRMKVPSIISWSVGFHLPAPDNGAKPEGILFCPPTTLDHLLIDHNIHVALFRPKAVEEYQKFGENGTLFVLDKDHDLADCIVSPASEAPSG